MTKKAFMNKKIKIIIALVLGFIIAMILMGICIYFGYTKAYSTKVNALTVKIFKIPIYRIIKDESKYVGKSLGINMGIFCGIFMIISIFIEEIISHIKHKIKIL